MTVRSARQREARDCGRFLDRASTAFNPAMVGSST